MSSIIYVEVVGAQGHEESKFWVDAGDELAMAKLFRLISLVPMANQSVHCIPVTTIGEVPRAIVVGGVL